MKTKIISMILLVAMVFSAASMGMVRAAYGGMAPGAPFAP